MHSHFPLYSIVCVCSLFRMDIKYHLSDFEFFIMCEESSDQIDPLYVTGTPSQDRQTLLREQNMSG